MRIALAQIVSTPNPADNLASLEACTEEAAKAGARLVIFPEATMCCFGTPLAPIAEPLDGPWADEVRAVASRTGTTVVAGMFTPASDGRVHNTLLATGGGVEASYDKIHLYDAFGSSESDAVAPGRDVVTIEVDGTTVGLSTCYDVRFPGLYQRLADAGARLIVLSASWGAGPGKQEQWDLLVRARALDTTCFLAACDQADPTTVGRERGSGPTGVGDSVVVTPYGAAVRQLGPEPGLLVVDIDVDEVEAARATLPVLANRRLS